MAPDTKLFLARVYTAAAILLLGALSILLYEHFADGLLSEVAHRLSIEYSSFSSSLAGR